MAAASRRVRTARRLPGSTAWQHHSIAPSRAAGEGVSLVPHSVYGLKRDNISYKPLDDPNLVSPIIMSMRVPDESKDVRAMQTLIYRLDTEANMPCRTCRPGRHERRSAGLTRRTSPGQHGLNTARPAIRRPLFRERGIGGRSTLKISPLTDVVRQPVPRANALGAPTRWLPLPICWLPWISARTASG